jgi:pilus assembly protein Flp/PilA
LLGSSGRINACYYLEAFPFLVGDLPLEELPARRGTTQEQEMKRMQDGILKLYVKAQILWNALKEDNGQDLVEYGLVLCLVCLAATAGMNTLASGINVAMTNITGKLSKYTS